MCTQKWVALINIASSNFERGGRYEIKKGQISWKAKKKKKIMESSSGRDIKEVS